MPAISLSKAIARRCSCVEEPFSKIQNGERLEDQLLKSGKPIRRKMANKAPCLGDEGRKENIPVEVIGE